MPHSMEEMLLPKVKKIDDNKADIYQNAVEEIPL